MNHCGSNRWKGFVLGVAGSVAGLMGLQAGPMAVSPAQHAHRFGAHLAYGLGTAVATRILRRLF